jgi:hypothetical protein
MMKMVLLPGKETEVKFVARLTAGIALLHHAEDVGTVCILNTKISVWKDMPYYVPGLQNFTVHRNKPKSTYTVYPRCFGTVPDPDPRIRLPDSGAG